MKLPIITIFTFLTQLINAQNLVPNPSFENRSSDFCGIMQSGDFYLTLTDWYSPSYGSPDLYFSNINPSCYNFQPSSSYAGPIGIKGSQIPRTGEVMAGLFLYTIQNSEQREYIQIPLISSLIIGEKYVVECYVSLADSTESATDKLGFYLSNQPVSIQSDGVLNFSPQVVSGTTILETQNWVKVSDTLIASDSFSYLTIGNFSSNAQTPTTPNPTSSGGVGTYGAYYFIDDVRVEHYRDSNEVSIDIIEFNKKERTLVKVLDFMGRETNYKPNTPLIFIYSDGTRERILKIEQ